MHKKKDEQKRQRAIAVINATISPGNCAGDSGSDNKRTTPKKLLAEQTTISRVSQGLQLSAPQDQIKPKVKASWDPETTPIPSSTVRYFDISDALP